MNRAIQLVLLTLVGLVAFTATAVAAPAVTGTDLLDLAGPVLDAFTGGKWALGASLALVALVALARKHAGDVPGPAGRFLAGDAGGAALVLLGAFGAALAVTLGTGAALGGGVAYAALKVAVVTAGGFSLVKKLVVDPLLRPLAAKAPAWMQPVFALVFWFFDRPTPTAKADAAGAAAVAAKPGKGVAGVTGSVRDVE